MDATVKYRNHCDCQAFGMEDKEDNIFWDPANTNRGGITEFKGLDVIASYTYRFGNDFVNWIRLSYQFGTGEFDYFGKNITQKYALTVRVVELPFTIFYFDGYGEDIAQYHLRSQYIGVGFEFW